MTIALITNIKNMPYKPARLIGGIILTLGIMIPQALIHGVDQMSHFSAFLQALLYMALPFFLDEEMIDEWTLRNLWISTSIAAVVLLPLSFAQPLTIGFNIMMFLAVVVITIVVQAYHEIIGRKKQLFDLNPDCDLYHYHEAKFIVPVIVIIGGLFMAVSRMEPMIVVMVMGLLVAYYAHETIELNETYKRFISSEKQKQEDKSKRNEQETDDEQRISSM